MKIIELIDWFIPERVHQNYIEQSRARIIVATSMFLTAVMMIMAIPIYMKPLQGGLESSAIYMLGDNHPVFFSTHRF